MITDEQVIDRPAPAPVVVPALEPGTLEVIVTLDDIRRGERNDEYMCAFGLALQRAGYGYTCVLYERVEVARGSGRVMAFDHTPESLAWVRAFDYEMSVTPERFVLHRRRSPEVSA